MTVPGRGGPPEVYTQERVEKLFSEYVDGKEWEVEGRANPSVFHFAQKVGTSRRYLQQKAEKEPWLSRIIKDIKEIQRDGLIEKGLLGQFNPTIAKLMLSHHGIHEKKIEERQNKKSIRVVREVVRAKEGNDG